MSEQATGPTSGEQGSLNAGISHSAETSSESLTASTTGDAVVPVSEPVMSGPSISEPSFSGPLASETSKVEAVKAEAGIQAARPETAKDKISNIPAKVIVMSRGERAWTDDANHSEPGAGEPHNVFGKRRIAAVA